VARRPTGDSNFRRERARRVDRAGGGVVRAPRRPPAAKGLSKGFSGDDAYRLRAASPPPQSSGTSQYQQNKKTLLDQRSLLISGALGASKQACEKCGDRAYKKRLNINSLRVLY
jgi:hypothetical protein